MKYINAYRTEHGYRDAGDFIQFGMRFYDLDIGLLEIIYVRRVKLAAKLYINLKLRNLRFK